MVEWLTVVAKCQRRFLYRRRKKETPQSLLPSINFKSRRGRLPNEIPRNAGPLMILGTREHDAGRNYNVYAETVKEKKGWFEMNSWSDSTLLFCRRGEKRSLYWGELILSYQKECNIKLNCMVNYLFNVSYTNTSRYVLIPEPIASSQPTRMWITACSFWRIKNSLRRLKDSILTLCTDFLYLFYYVVIFFTFRFAQRRAVPAAVSFLSLLRSILIQMSKLP